MALEMYEPDFRARLNVTRGQIDTMANTLNLMRTELQGLEREFEAREFLSGRADPSVFTGAGMKPTLSQQEAIRLLIRDAGRPLTARHLAAALRPLGYGRGVSPKNFYASIKVTLNRLRKRKVIDLLVELSPPFTAHFEKGANDTKGDHGESAR